MLCLGIESSCDETAAAIVSDDRKILSHVIYSQIPEHQKYGGVVPELAARAHILAIDEVVRKTLADAGKTIADIDVVAATAGPGLIGGVIVGWEFAVGLAQSAAKPIVAVNHLEGHALVPRLSNDVEFPYLLLLASGGHTQILLARGVGDYEIIGQTIDDSAGEAFDKVAKMLGLPYPGGPEVDARAQNGNPAAFDFPRPLCDKPNCDFSFSGIKTSVRTLINSPSLAKGCRVPGPTKIENFRGWGCGGVVADNEKALTTAPSCAKGAIHPCASEGELIDNVCASFQQAVVDVVLNRIQNALRDERVANAAPKTIVVAGGVAKNSAIRAALEKFALDNNLQYAAPPLSLCTDNGAMIAWAGIENFKLGKIVRGPVAPRPRWPLVEL
jgi:N6-L-threonylcarbamoyladenine synthase